MKHHLILKMRRPLADSQSIPNWLDFITDKSVVRERVEPGVDKLLDDLGLRVWVTHEYEPARGDWATDEIREGLNRTYRLILQQDYALPPDLVDRIKLIPSVEKAHELTIGEAELPKPGVAETMAIVPHAPGDMIHLAYAKALTRGVPDVRIAVIDTGINLDHRELRGKVVKAADFVDLEGLDTSDFIGDITGYDDVPEDEVGHGPHVSGIVAARGLQMDEGIAPECSLVAIRVLATMRTDGRLYGAGIVDNINPGIKSAVDSGAAVINMSLGIKHTGGGLP